MKGKYHMNEIALLWNDFKIINVIQFSYVPQ